MDNKRSANNKKMNKSGLIITFLTFAVVAFTALISSAQAANPTYKFRCSTTSFSDPEDEDKWGVLSGSAPCGTEINERSKNVVIYVQFEKTEGNQTSRTRVYEVKIAYQAGTAATVTPVATTAPRATSTPAPTVAAGATVTPSPTGVASVTPTPTSTPAPSPKACTYTKTAERWCCPAPSTLCISPEDAQYDFNCDCKVNSPDHGMFIKHWSK